MSAAAATAIFTRQGECWRPAPQCMGPFGGMHGGAVSGLLTGELEMMAADAGHGPAISANIYLLRPAPSTLVETRPRALREGARVAVYENELWAGGKLQAKASMCFLKALPDSQAIAAMPDAIAGTLVGEPLLDPSELAEWDFPRAPMAQSYLNAVEIRDDGKGMIWIRAKQPLFSAPTPCASTISFADFSTLFSVVATGTRPEAGGWPNADLSVHLARLPDGPWIGQRIRSDLFADGRGVTEAEIWDVHGRIGRSTQAVVLAPAAAST